MHSNITKILKQLLTSEGYVMIKLHVAFN